MAEELDAQANSTQGLVCDDAGTIGTHPHAEAHCPSRSPSLPWASWVVTGKSEQCSDPELGEPERVSPSAPECIVTDETDEMDQMKDTMQVMEAMVTGKEESIEAFKVMHEFTQLRQELSKALADKDEALAREKALLEQLRWLSPKLGPTERPSQAEYRTQAEAFLQRRLSTDSKPFRPVID